MPTVKSKTKARKTTTKLNKVLLRRDKSGKISQVFLNGTRMKFLTDMNVSVPNTDGTPYVVNMSMLAEVTIQESTNGKNR